MDTRSCGFIGFWCLGRWFEQTKSHCDSSTYSILSRRVINCLYEYYLMIANTVVIGKGLWSIGQDIKPKKRQIVNIFVTFVLVA